MEAYYLQQEVRLQSPTQSPPTNGRSFGIQVWHDGSNSSPRGVSIGVYVGALNCPDGMFCRFRSSVQAGKHSCGSSTPKTAKGAGRGGLWVGKLLPVGVYEGGMGPSSMGHARPASKWEAADH